MRIARFVLFYFLFGCFVQGWQLHASESVNFRGTELPFLMHSNITEADAFEEPYVVLNSKSSIVDIDGVNKKVTLFESFSPQPWISSRYFKGRIDEINAEEDPRAGPVDLQPDSVSENYVVVIRRILPNDDKAMKAVVDRFWESLPEYENGTYAKEDTPLSDEQSIHERFSDGLYLVLEKIDSRSGDSVIVGGAGYLQLPAPAGVYELCKFYIDAQYRSLGLGRTLLFCVVENAFARANCKEVYLETIKSFGAANTLYRDFGFEVTDSYVEGFHVADIFLHLVKSHYTSQRGKLAEKAPDLDERDMNKWFMFLGKMMKVLQMHHSEMSYIDAQFAILKNAVDHIKRTNLERSDKIFNGLGGILKLLDHVNKELNLFSLHMNSFKVKKSNQSEDVSAAFDAERNITVGLFKDAVKNCETIYKKISALYREMQGKDIFQGHVKKVVGKSAA